MNKKAIFIATLLLCAVAVIAIYYISSNQASMVKYENNSDANKPVLESKASALARLKATQDLVSANPWPDKTKMKDYSAQIDKIAIDSKVLEINYCAPNPGVLHLKIGQSFTLKNSDSAFHKLNDDKFVFQAGAHSEQQITPNFTAGMYFFRCDGPFAGIIWVTP